MSDNPFVSYTPKLDTDHVFEEVFEVLRQFSDALMSTTLKDYTEASVIEPELELKNSWIINLKWKSRSFTSNLFSLSGDYQGYPIQVSSKGTLNDGVWESRKVKVENKLQLVKQLQSILKENSVYLKLKARTSLLRHFPVQA